MDIRTQTLINRAKNNDAEALNALFAKYQNRVLRIVRLRLTASLRVKLKMQSMDITQEIFLSAFKKLDQFELTSEGAFIYWLTKIVQNYIRDRLDYASAQKRVAPKGEFSLDSPIATETDNEMKVLDIMPSKDTSPSQHVLRKENKDILDELLLKLDDKDREIIIHRDLEDLTFVEISKILEKSEDAVRKQYNRAFQKLIEFVEKSSVYKEYEEFL